MRDAVADDAGVLGGDECFVLGVGALGAGAEYSILWRASVATTRTLADPIFGLAPLLTSSAHGGVSPPPPRHDGGVPSPSPSDAPQSPQSLPHSPLPRATRLYRPRRLRPLRVHSRPPRRRDHHHRRVRRQPPDRALSRTDLRGTRRPSRADHGEIGTRSRVAALGKGASAAAAKSV